MNKNGPKKLPTDPFDELDRMFEEMSQRMLDMMRQMGLSGLADEPVFFSYTSVNSGSTPRLKPARHHEESIEEPEFRPPEGPEPLIDIWDNEKKVTVLVELPGVTKEDIDIEVEGRCLYLTVETEKKTFNEQINLPCSVKVSSAVANYHNGVLEVSLDKTAPRKKKRSKLKVS